MGLPARKLYEEDFVSPEKSNNMKYVQGGKLNQQGMPQQQQEKYSTFDVVKLIPYGIAYQIMESIPDTGRGLLDSTVDMFRRASRQAFYGLGKNTMRPVFNNYGFWKGASNIEEYYTAEFVNFEGKLVERPIFISNPKIGTPSTVELTRRFRNLYRDRLGLDQYNKDMVSASFNPVYNYSGADIRYMNSDLRDRSDLREFFDAFSKMDLWHIQAMGDKKDLGTVNVQVMDVQGNQKNVDAKLSKYERPSNITTWLYNQTGNVIYDLFDNLIYNPIEKYFGSTFAKQIPIEKQFQGATQVTKEIWSNFAKNAPLEHYT